MIRQFSVHKFINRYNVGVTGDSKHRVVRAETVGLIVIAVVLAIMVLARWGGIIHWSAR